MLSSIYIIGNMLYAPAWENGPDLARFRNSGIWRLRRYPVPWFVKHYAMFPLEMPCPRSAQGWSATTVHDMVTVGYGADVGAA